MKATIKKYSYSELIDQALNMKGSTSNTYNRFYNYSYMNRVLLYLQGVSEPVATYKKWQELGRQVNKGSKAKFICRPVIYKDKETEEMEIKGFNYINCLFSYGETTGEDLPPVEIEAWNKDLALEKLQITLEEYASTSGNTQGYSFNKSYAINPMAKYPVKTTMHELSHIVAGHTTSKQIEHAGLAEFQAEASAYILMHELELTDHFNASESRSYIQNWLQEMKPTDQDIKIVFKTVDTILKAGRKEKPTDEQK